MTNCLPSLKDLKSLTVQVDTREKCPLLFPATIELSDCSGRTKHVPLSITRRKIGAGDYTLEIEGRCCNDLVVVERKGSIRELASNFLDPNDCARQLRSFRLLSDYTLQPALLLEVPLHDFFTQRPADARPNRVPQLLHRLFVAAGHYGLQLLWVPKPGSIQSRRNLGSFIVHYMWSVVSHRLTQEDQKYPQLFEKTIKKILIPTVENPEQDTNPDRSPFV
jgi:hypothetical protein